MKKLIALTLLLTITLPTPAISAGVKYAVYQKTLHAFSKTSTTLASQQKFQVQAAVEANPDADLCRVVLTGPVPERFLMPVHLNLRRQMLSEL